MISLHKDLIMKSLPFPFHAFLHGVQGQYCAWHPLQVLVGSVQTFSLFLIRKKVFFCHDCESDEGLGDVVHGPPAWKEGAFENRTQRGEKTDKTKKLGNVIGVCLCSRKAKHIYDKSVKKVLTSHSSCATVATRPCPSLSSYYHGDMP